MKTKLFTLILLAGGSLFAETHWSIGIGVGTPYYYAPPPAVVYAPPCPGPEYTWIPRYYYLAGSGYTWHTGFWSRPPYEGLIGLGLDITNTATIRDIGSAGNATGIIMTSAGSIMTAESIVGGTGTTVMTTNSECQKKTLWPTFHDDGREY